MGSSGTVFIEYEVFYLRGKRADDSLDQTTRMYGEWIRDGKRSWHEVARPQIHGYDLNAISSLSDWKFVSGADEKVLRVFQMSRTTAKLVNRLAGRASDIEVRFPLNLRSSPDSNISFFCA